MIDDQKGPNSCYAKAFPTTGNMGGNAWAADISSAKAGAMANCMRYASDGGGDPRTCRVTYAKCNNFLEYPEGRVERTELDPKEGDESSEIDKETSFPEDTLCDFTASEEEIANAVCTPGEEKCINQWIHKCNSSGRWFSTERPC